MRQLSLLPPVLPAVLPAAATKSFYSMHEVILYLENTKYEWPALYSLRICLSAEVRAGAPSSSSVPATPMLSIAVDGWTPESNSSPSPFRPAREYRIGNLRTN